MMYWFSNNSAEFNYEYSAAGLFILVVDKYGEKPERYAFASKEDALDALWAREVEF
ncbi:MAG: hypothetical protein IJI45_11500 [Anaerolineaceae bacterium]|nr:hypothetical protein [Anaerolineaceae bacterium]